MDSTRTRAAADAAGAEGTAETARPGRARARAYLDLWERNLVHVALHGPESRPEVPPEAPAGKPRRDRQPA